MKGYKVLILLHLQEKFIISEVNLGGKPNLLFLIYVLPAGHSAIFMRKLNFVEEAMKIKYVCIRGSLWM